MELLEGNSLEKLYRGHAMPYPKLVEMGVQLADALDAAHRKGFCIAISSRQISL